MLPVLREPMGKVAELRGLQEPKKEEQMSIEKVEEYTTLHRTAEDLWGKISDQATRELREFLDAADHDILMDIASGKKLIWPPEIVSLASALKRQGDVIALLEQIVIEMKSRAAPRQTRAGV